MIKVGDIFTPGSVPSYTYIPRDKHKLEKKLERMYKNYDGIIVITGESKSGKTVLWKKIIGDECIEVDAVRLKNPNDLWVVTAQKLNLSIKNSQIDTICKSHETEANVKGGISVGIATVKSDIIGKDKEEYSKSEAVETFLSLYDIVINELISKKKALVIEDFHYINSNIQKEIVRLLKNPISKGLKVVILAVPHKVSDVIKSERDLQGRVHHIRIPIWENEELSEIARKGFQELNVSYSEELIKSLVAQSFKNPNLIQNLCLILCFENDIDEKLDNTKKIQFPSCDEKEYYLSFAKEYTSNDEYQRIVSSGRQSSRIVFTYNDGTIGDLYIGILKVIANILPEREISSVEIKDKLNNIISDEKKPQSNQITQSLNYMSKIMNEVEGNNTPVLEYIGDKKQLVIIDPFFAFNLKWGKH